jgi:hypothetical protein
LGEGAERLTGSARVYSPGDVPADAVTGEPLLDKYLKLTREALQRVRPATPRRSYLAGASDDFLAMARAYLSDAEHFERSGDPDRALAAVSYAHGWLDAGVRLGLLDGGDDEVRFTLFR